MQAVAVPEIVVFTPAPSNFEVPVQPAAVVIVQAPVDEQQVPSDGKQIVEGVQASPLVLTPDPRYVLVPVQPRGSAITHPPVLWQHAPISAVQGLVGRQVLPSPRYWFVPKQARPETTVQPAAVVQQAPVAQIVGVQEVPTPMVTVPVGQVVPRARMQKPKPVVSQQAAVHGAVGVQAKPAPSQWLEPVQLAATVCVQTWALEQHAPMAQGLGVHVEPKPANTVPVAQGNGPK